MIRWKICVALACTLCGAFAHADEPARLTTVHRIVIDPGHGGENEGAVGVAEIYERFLTLRTAQRLRTRLLETFDGLEVILTRETDIDVGLSARTHFANVREADLFISVHYNAAANVNAHGIEVFYLAADNVPGAPTMGSPVVGPADGLVAAIASDLARTDLNHLSAELAHTLLPCLVDATGALRRGVRQAQFRVLRGALMPAVVVELGFLTHSDEGDRLVEDDYTELLVDGLVEGIREFDALAVEAGWSL